MRLFICKGVGVVLLFIWFCCLICDRMVVGVFGFDIL